MRTNKNETKYVCYLAPLKDLKDTFVKLEFKFSLLKPIFKRNFRKETETNLKDLNC